MGAKFGLEAARSFVLAPDKLQLVEFMFKAGVLSGKDLTVLRREFGSHGVGVYVEEVENCYFNLVVEFPEKWSWEECLACCDVRAFRKQVIDALAEHEEQKLGFCWDDLCTINDVRVGGLEKLEHAADLVRLGVERFGRSVTVLVYLG